MFESNLNEGGRTITNYCIWLVHNHFYYCTKYMGDYHFYLNNSTSEYCNPSVSAHTDARTHTIWVCNNRQG